MGIKEGCISWDKGKDARSEQPEQQGIELQFLINPGWSIALRFCQDHTAADALGPAEHPEKIGTEIHFVGEVTQLLINIECLRKQKYLDLIMTLEFEPVTNFCFEILEISIVPDHTNLIHQENRPGRDIEKTDIVIVDVMAAVQTLGTINLPTIGKILIGKTYHQSCLTGTLLTKHHNQLVRVNVLPGKEMESSHKSCDPKHKFKNESQRNHLESNGR